MPPLSSVALALLSTLTIGAAPEAEPGLLPFEATQVELPNGMRVVLVPYDSPGLLAYYSLVRVGSRDEVERGVTGFAHFFEHMMFRGTEAWPPDRVQDLLKRAGADQNGFTTDDYTCYTYVGSNAVLDELIAYDADRFQNLEYSEQDFKTEAGAVLGEYNKSTSGTYLPLQERIREKVFTRHTYGHTTLGYAKDIRDMPNQYAYSKTFFERFYTPRNVTVIVVGDFDLAQTEAAIRKAYGPWSRKGTPSRVRAEPKQRKAIRDSVRFKEKTLPRLSMNWRTPATRYDSRDTAVYNLLFELLFGKISPLYTELVLESQVVAALHDWSWDHRDPYYFHVVATVKDEMKIEAVEEKIRAAVAAMANGEIDADHLAAVKSHVRYGLLLDLNTPNAIALALARFIGPTGELDGLERLLAGIEAVTAQDIQRFARTYLTDRNGAVVTLLSRPGEPR